VATDLDLDLDLDHARNAHGTRQERARNAQPRGDLTTPAQRA
jgi:hypothetical protein